MAFSVPSFHHTVHTADGASRVRNGTNLPAQKGVEKQCTTHYRSVANIHRLDLNYFGKDEEPEKGFQKYRITPQA
jgi:hypothetical protein